MFVLLISLRYWSYSGFLFQLFVLSFSFSYILHVDFSCVVSSSLHIACTQYLFLCHAWECFSFYPLVTLPFPEQLVSCNCLEGVNLFCKLIIPFVTCYFFLFCFGFFSLYFFLYTIISFDDARVVFFYLNKIPTIDKTSPIIIIIIIILQHETILRMNMYSSVPRHIKVHLYVSVAWSVFL